MVEIKVCIGSSCHLKGSYHLINALQQLLEKSGKADWVDLKGVFCLGHCSESVSVLVDGEYYGVTPDNARAFYLSTVEPKLK